MELLPDDFPEEAEVSGWRAVRSRVRNTSRLPGEGAAIVAAGYEQSSVEVEARAGETA